MEVRRPGVQVEPDGRDPQHSDAARDLDGRVRGLVSDLSHFDVRKRRRPSNRAVWLIVVSFFLLVLAFVVALTYFRGSRGTTAAPVATGATASSPVDVGSGELAGTWVMYNVGSDGTERHAFTIRFDGDGEGTIDVLEDTTEIDATFRLEGGLVTLGFTRILDVASGDWSEMSSFAGSFVGPDEIAGEYAREAWACLVDRDPPCAYEPEPIRFPSRMLRQP